MTKFSLEVFALQELRVVKDKEVNRSQSFLERNRRRRLKRGDEAVHEFLSGQIDDRPPFLSGLMGDGLQKMGLAGAKLGPW